LLSTPGIAAADFTFELHDTEGTGGAGAAENFTTIDLDGAGAPDLIASNDFAHSVHCWTVDPDGGLTTPVCRFERLEFDSPDALAVSDFDRDGIDDLALELRYFGPVARWRGRQVVSIFLGRGSGRFVHTDDLVLRADNPELALFGADFNGDRKPDLGIFRRDTTRFALVLGRGDGRLQSRRRYRSIAASSRGFELSDLNGDGDPDLVGLDRDANRLTTRLGGLGASFRSRWTFPVPSGSQSFFLGDLGNDAYIDLVVRYVDKGGPWHTLTLDGVGDGTFLPGGGFRNQYAMATAEFSPGSPDLLLSAVDPFVIREGNGDHTFQPPVSTGLPDENLGYVADFNRDGRADVLTQEFIHECDCSKAHVYLQQAP
jgi:FG-GAP-like repeat